MGGRILIVEDETAIADTIAYALKTDGFEPVRATTGVQALGILADAAVALIILDVGLPDTDGFALAREIRKSVETPIIFLTARNDEIDRVVGLELGADDYVTKPFSPRELAARVKAVLRRIGAPAPAAAGARGAFQVDEQRFEIRFRNLLLDLSVSEYKILKVMSAAPGRVFTREHLMSLCWEDPGMSLERTIDTHIKNLRQKFRTAGVEEEVIVTHRGLGYSLAEGLA